MKLPQFVQVNDVMLRDGLQLEEKVLSVDEKYNLAQRLLNANVKQLEFGSFVHPKLVPQMANSGELFNKLKKYDNATFVSLIPNLKGAESAAKLGVKELNFVFSASNSHNLQNVRQTTDQSLESFIVIKKFCNDHDIKLNASIATTFGCPFEGNVPTGRIHSIIEKLNNEGVNMITLADTTGMANPKQVFELVNSLDGKYPLERLNLHFHNTRGMGLANVLAGAQAGVTNFDAALGGLGGCPFAPGATGNVSTEDVVHMFHGMGVETGIDLDLLIDTSKVLQEILGVGLSSMVLKAGKSNRKYPLPEENNEEVI